MADSLVEMPSALLVNFARRLGIDPLKYERGELIDQFKRQTEDYKTVLDFKKARSANREYNAEATANTKVLQLQQAASKNRNQLFGFLGAKK